VAGSFGPPQTVKASVLQYRVSDQIFSRMFGRDGVIVAQTSHRATPMLSHGLPF